MHEPQVHERRFPTMGSKGHIVVVGGPAELADRGVERLAQLEARWSRFLPTSELSQLNEADGRPLLVSGDTLVLVDALRSAWDLTGGRFDPTVYDAMRELGYVTSWPEVVSSVRLDRVRPAPGLGRLEERSADGLVRLPPGIRLDPGGLGKGLAADLVATELKADGAEGVLVNVGGDLRVIGRAPEGPDWVVAVEAPDAKDGQIAQVQLSDGGVATSTSARRHWQAADGTPLHHLVDPRTGLPAEPTWRQVTAVSARAWWAEVLATVTFLDGELGDDTAAALVVEGDGTIRILGVPDWFTLVPEMTP
jgi:thiamine biosynthesis lipoprotein